VLRGFVQGRGVRPALARLAGRCGIAGWVRNTPAGVELWLEGQAAHLNDFVAHMGDTLPSGAGGEVVSSQALPPQGATGFVILPSLSGPQVQVRAPPDRALCAACSREVREPGNRRYGYPLTTCAECGPRYTILESLPYDRPRLSLRRFGPCADCRAEYDDPRDRRHHVEGIVCGACGPQVQLWDAAGRALARGDTAIRQAAERLARGGIVAAKGIGGYQLLLRADSTVAVERLRKAKSREAKPLAVMVPGLSWLDDHGITGPPRELLCSPQNPIVLVHAAPGPLGLCPEIAPHLHSTGLLWPTTPLHQLLLDQIAAPLVATSGNAAGAPLAVDETAAVRELGPLADLLLVHDRPIVRRADDSVVCSIGGQTVVLRLARGYAPWPLEALEALADGPPLAALGGHQKSAVALWTGSQAVLGPHIGELDHPLARGAFRQTLNDLAQLYDCRPTSLVCDLHPEYYTTAWAESCGHPMTRVQHHHAHAAAVLCEHHRMRDEVLALVWDGTGFGTDGTIWGGEALLASAAEYGRVGSLWPFPLPGGEAAVREPRRTALGMFVAAQGATATLEDAELLERLQLEPDEARVLARMIDRRVRTPWTSSLGRLFDGVAALLLRVGEVGYESEAALRLEAAAGTSRGDTIGLPLRALGPCAALGGDRDVLRGDWRPLLIRMWQAVRRGGDVAQLSATFHDSIAAWGVAVVRQFPARPVALGGGCFYNARLRESLIAGLRRDGREVLAAGRIPPGDGGLAAGQLAVALARNRRT
jgi:hydrogenase maturation protein HypF